MSVILRFEAEVFIGGSSAVEKKTIVLPKTRYCTPESIEVNSEDIVSIWLTMGRLTNAFHIKTWMERNLIDYNVNKKIYLDTGTLDVLRSACVEAIDKPYKRESIFPDPLWSVYPEKYTADINQLLLIIGKAQEYVDLHDADLYYAVL